MAIRQIPHLQTETKLLPAERNTVSQNVGSGDSIVCMARQSRLSGAVLSQSLIVATARKVLLVDSALLRNPKISSIPYDQIDKIELENGTFSASLLITVRRSEHIHGPTMKDRIYKEAISGLAKKDAYMLFTHIKSTIDSLADHSAKWTKPHQHVKVHAATAAEAVVQARQEAAKAPAAAAEKPTAVPAATVTINAPTAREIVAANAAAAPKQVMHAPAKAESKADAALLMSRRHEQADEETKDNGEVYAKK